MPGQPNRQTDRKVSKSRKAYYTARDRVLTLATSLEKIRPGAGDALLDQAAMTLDHIREQTLSAFPQSGK